MEEQASLTHLRDELSDVELPLDIGGVDDARENRARTIRRLDDHVLPRLSHLDAPLLCVVGGSTGAGKSTIVNSLVGQQLSASSARRPTTRRPLLIHREEDARWYEDTRILPSLARVRVDPQAPPSEPTKLSTRELELRVNNTIPPGIAILDAPDLDSVVADNRVLARQLLDAADLWVFVTTAARYADAVPWAMLSDAASRNISVAVVLNRVPPGAINEIRPDLSRMLAQADLGRAPLIAIEEGHLNDGILPANVLSPLSNWLVSLSDTAQARAKTAKRTLRGTVTTVLDASEEVLLALQAQQYVAIDAAAVIDTQIEGALRRIEDLTQNGTLLRGEVLNRWQEVIGTAELSRKIDEGISWIKARVTGFLTGKPNRAAPVENAIQEGLAALLAEQLATTEERVRSSWHQNNAMREIETTVAETPPATYREHAETVTRQWQRDLLEMVRTEGSSRKTTARILAIGVNLLGVALMIVIFASTGGLTGAEVGVAGATSVVAQRLLESVFGDQAVARMTKQAHDMLLERCKDALTDTLGTLARAVPELSDGEELKRAIMLARRAWEESGWEKEDS
ncbi:MAG: dynamin family protein [Actinomycetaceae bacterium]|nr:dynamin family protein [Actinomycetaceae bacterium]